MWIACLAFACSVCLAQRLPLGPGRLSMQLCRPRMCQPDDGGFRGRRARDRRRCEIGLGRADSTASTDAKLPMNLLFLHRSAWTAQFCEKEPAAAKARRTSCSHAADEARSQPALCRSQGDRIAQRAYRAGPTGLAENAQVCPASLGVPESDRSATPCGAPIPRCVVAREPGGAFPHAFNGFSRPHMPSWMNGHCSLISRDGRRGGSLVGDHAASAVPRAR